MVVAAGLPLRPLSCVPVRRAPSEMRVIDFGGVRHLVVTATNAAPEKRRRDRFWDGRELTGVRARRPEFINEELQLSLKDFRPSTH
jgi:hypothetical protein